MGAVAVGALLVAVVLLVVAAFVWQTAARSPVTETPLYVVGEAAEYIHARLSDRALASLDRDGVRRLLEWGLQYTQVVGPRTSHRPPVIGSGEGIEYVMEKAAQAGWDVEPLDIAEVMAVETDYLLEIGAVGAPVEDET